MNKQFLSKLFIAMGVIIVILLLVRGYQLWRDTRRQKQTNLQETMVQFSRDDADHLLERLENLTVTKDGLTLPQVELSIKL